MNKQQFTERLSDECELSKAEAGRTLDAILDSITEALRTRDEVSFPGFGKFVAVKQKARDSANPQDRSQRLHIAARTVPKFRPGTGLKEAVSQIPAPSTAAPNRQPAAAGQPRESAPAGWKPLSDRK